MNINRFLFLLIFVPPVMILTGCMTAPIIPGRIDHHVNPAEEFSRANAQGRAEDFSIYRVANNSQAKANYDQLQQNRQHNWMSQAAAKVHPVDGDPDMLQRGLQYQGSVVAPQNIPDQLAKAPAARMPAPSHVRPVGPASNFPLPPPGPPPGSSSPYYRGQMTSNPSLWPDGMRGASLFHDFRAYQAMDVITIRISEKQTGSKSAETETKDEFTLEAGISEFFGIETTKWAANNTSLTPATLINANTQTEFKGEGDTTRTGSLTGSISAVVMEVMPNGLLRVEGTKIISVNDEEEIMVISGLVRQRDISSNNTVNSTNIANMRIDFYGRGLIAENNKPGWAARIFQMVWPF